MLGLLRAFIVCAAPTLAAGPVCGQAPHIPPPTGMADPRLAPLDDLVASFVRDDKVPGASLAVARNGRLVYSRGFGFADIEKRECVQPDSLFRIASISKPLTSAAVMRLVEQGKLSLDDHPFTSLGIEPAVKEGQKPDERLAGITVRDLLTHAGGFDRGRSGDPMFGARQIASDLHIPSPPAPTDIIRWVSARPLDFDPGTKSVYSNFGYCVLGRVVEHASGETYERYVQQSVLRPLGITRMRIGRTLEPGRAEGEVRYYAAEDGGRTVFDDSPGPAPNPYGSWCLESMDAHGGWIASAPDLVRFAAGLGQNGGLLSPESFATLWARPAYVGAQPTTYYGLGWAVHPVGDPADLSHNGSLPGSSTLLVRRHDGVVWAVLFNSRQGDPAGRIDGPIRKVLDEVKEWPEGEPLFTARSGAPPASGVR